MPDWSDSATALANTFQAAPKLDLRGHVWMMLPIPNKLENSMPYIHNTLSESVLSLKHYQLQARARLRDRVIRRVETLGKYRT